jgi:hypothetical protein
MITDKLASYPAAKKDLLQRSNTATGRKLAPAGIVAKSPGHGKGHRVGSGQGAVDGRVPVAAFRRRSSSPGALALVTLGQQNYAVLRRVAASFRG